MDLNTNKSVNKSSKSAHTSENKSTTSEQKQQSLKINNFNPMKGSPNLFMTKLEFRLRYYQVEEELLKDPLTL